MVLQHFHGLRLRRYGLLAVRSTVQPTLNHVRLMPQACQTHGVDIIAALRWACLVSAKP